MGIALEFGFAWFAFVRACVALAFVAWVVALKDLSFVAFVACPCVAFAEQGASVALAWLPYVVAFVACSLTLCVGYL